MIEFMENNIFIFVLLAVAAMLCLSVSSIRREKNRAAVRKINYDNYKKYIKYCSRNVSIPLIAALAVFLALSILLLVFCAVNPLSRGYLWGLAPVVFAAAVFLVAAISAKMHKGELDRIEGGFNYAKNLIEKAESIQKELEKYQLLDNGRLSAYISELESAAGEIRANFNSGVKPWLCGGKVHFTRIDEPFFYQRLKNTITAFLSDAAPLNDSYSFFNRTLLDSLSAEEYKRIFNAIVKNDALKCCYAFLSALPAEHIASAAEVISGPETKKNSCVNAFLSYLNLLNNSRWQGSVCDEHINMAFALREYYNKFPSGNEQNKIRISRIIQTDSFDAEARLIEQLYESAAADIHQAAAPLANIVNIYNSSLASGNKILDNNKIGALARELKSNLDKNGLILLAMLISGIILLFEYNDEIINMALSCIGILDPADSYASQKGVAAITGRRIVRDIAEKQRNGIVNILNRIEKNRLSYEIIRAL